MSSHEWKKQIVSIYTTGAWFFPENQKITYQRHKGYQRLPTGTKPTWDVFFRITKSSRNSGEVISALFKRRLGSWNHANMDDIDMLMFWEQIALSYL